MLALRAACLCVVFSVLAVSTVRTVEAATADEPAPPKASQAKDKPKPNRLARESSPYLLQHAHNPVDWYPWGAEAFEKAKKEDKLIFLSIGYSSCHWCHVMERESFSNEEIARTMNEHFVCIKVDREERPDIDEIYMTALQVTGQHGGWPLTMILTPTGKPIFGGTYFPPADKKVGEDVIPGMKSILNAVIEMNKKERPDLFKQADAIAERTVDALNRNSRAIALIKLERELVGEVAGAYEIDPEYGGTGSKARSFKGTKFPSPPVWSFLLGQSRKPGREELAKQVSLTLHQIAAGGIYDHLGGGFHRYSTERTWTVPHFEKMLYDNAQLVELYSEAYARKPDPAYKRAASETLAFIQREMTSPEGGFYSALDADSNHQEGEFYIWTPDQIRAVLANEADAALFLSVYASTAPNFEGKFHILRLPRPFAEIAREKKLSEEELLGKLEPLKKKLLEARAKRVRPFLDTKIIAAWNGQMIAGCARAGAVFRDKRYTEMAATAARFALSQLRGPDGRLFRVWAAVPGEKPAARGTAFLDDYASLIHGLLSLHDATGEAEWLAEARALTDVVLKWYGDGDRGGFFYTPSDGEKLFARSKDCYDGVQPSGNSQMACNLLSLWKKTKEYRYRDLCVKTIKAFVLAFRTAPSSVPTLAQCLDELLDSGAIESTAGSAKDASKSPKESADVVAAAVKLGDKTKTGEQPFTLTLTVAPGWHIYANPVGDDALLESQTAVSLTKGDARVSYPKGEVITDSSGSKYAVYSGTVVLTGKAQPGDETIEFRVKVVACKENACLRQSVLKVKP